MSSKRRSAILFCMLGLAIHGVPAASAQGKDEFPVGSFKLRGSRLEFRGDGTYKIADDKATYVEGRYTVQEEQLSVTDESGPYACQGKDAKTGVYKWEISGDELVFHVLQDKCDARRTALLEKPLPKVKA